MIGRPPELRCMAGHLTDRVAVVRWLIRLQASDM